MRRVELAGPAETFDWLPQATELGWSGSDGAVLDRDPVPPPSARTRRSSSSATNRGGRRRRIAIRAAAIGYGLVGTIHGDRLEDVLATLRRPPVKADDDELSRLGIVLVVRRVDGGRAAGRRRALPPPDRPRRARARPAPRPGRACDLGRRPATSSSTSAGASPRSSRRGSAAAPATSSSTSIIDARFLADLAAAGTADPERVRSAIAAYESIIPAVPTAT